MFLLLLRCGKYTIEECEGVEPGTKVVCHLKIGDRQFADDKTIKGKCTASDYLFEE